VFPSGLNALGLVIKIWIPFGHVIYFERKWNAIRPSLIVQPISWTSKVVYYYVIVIIIIIMIIIIIIYSFKTQLFIMANLNSCCWTRQPSSGHVLQKFVNDSSVIYSYINLFFYDSVTYGQMMAAFCRRNMQLFIFASSVDIATRFGLDSLGIQSRCRQIYRTCPEWPWGPHRLLCSVYRAFPWGYSCRCVTLTTHPHLTPRLCSTAIPLLSPLGRHSLL